MNTVIPLITSIVFLSFIFFLSRTIVQDLFTVLHRILRVPSLVFRAVAFLFLPGTLVHEAAHYIAAKLLFLKVIGFSLVPQWKHNNMRLGSVTYIRRDPFRGILVGIAPVLIGVIILERLISLIPFPTHLDGYTAFYVFSIFLISATMFSSKQDLVDLLRILPYAIIVIVLFYFLDIDYTRFVPSIKAVLKGLSPYLTRVNNSLGIVLGIQGIFFLIMKVIRLFIR